MAYDWEDLMSLRHAWEETFGESMPMGFEIGPDQYPTMKECIEKRDQAPLEDFINGLDPDVVY